MFPTKSIQLGRGLGCLQRTRISTSRRLETAAFPSLQQSAGLEQPDIRSYATARNGVSSPNSSDRSSGSSKTNEKPVNHEALILKMYKSSEIDLSVKSDRNVGKFDIAQNFAAKELLDDFLRRGGHPRTPMLEHLVLLACIAHDDQQIQRLLALYQRHWLAVSVKSIELIGAHYCQISAVEQCLAFYDEQTRFGRFVSPEAWQRVIEKLLFFEETEAVLEILQKLALQHKNSGTFGLSRSVYFDALTAFADLYDHKGLQWIWDHAVRSGLLTRIDMGTCTKVLNVSARYGLPILGTDVLKYMASERYAPQLHHYAALIESYCNAGDVKNAFNILSIMRREGVPPSRTSAAAILRFMSADLDLVDRAFFTLQDIKQEGGSIDVAAYNAVIDASVIRRDISRAVATYQEYKSLDVQPNIDTLNSLIAGCVASVQKELALSMIKTFRDELGIKANQETYTNLISVCLMESNYEDAFKFLEEMKEEGHQPPLSVYKLLVRRCVLMGDPRADIAFEEMRGWGYKDPEVSRLFNVDRQARMETEPITDNNSGVFDRLRLMTDPERIFSPRHRGSGSEAPVAASSPTTDLENK